MAKKKKKDSKIGAEVIWKYFDPRKQAASTYYFDHSDDESRALIDAINVALALGKPLLVTGPAGAGKSSIARGVAHATGWPQFPSVTVTSRMEAESLKAEFDDLQRLSDASASRDDVSIENYINPGILWQFFNPEDALDQWGKKTGKQARKRLQDVVAKKATTRILLIDEIDKGDIDFTNDLLDVFDTGVFEVPRIGHSVKREDDVRYLIVISSNQEQALFSEAFVRRCIPVQLSAFNVDKARKIAAAHSAWLEAEKNLTALSKKDIERLVDEPVFPDLDSINAALLADYVHAAMEFKARSDSDFADLLVALSRFSGRRHQATQAISGS